ncbi:hypothetical protein QBC40DRAFT_14253 [Triangularia verruculosa]|uniref:Ysc84 actin-binding domain-containing protein n=1 Tax=Triangularia verruculosa TaxID=2587418 RepID=A0AAN6X9L0_9PEZI|nr:hypothetical protein QBC40DRAFT_14253 [Triangularia verruculosa]
MSSSDQKPPLDPADKQSFPPPPPGPPPISTAPQAQVPKHPNDIPLPDYDIPGYNPRNPQFAPSSGVEDDIYNATPTSEHPPQFPPSGDGHHDAAESKKKSKFSFKEYYQKASDSLTTHVGPAVNAMARKTGAEGFIAESLDKECEKAARILRAFCKDGIYVDAAQQPSSTPVPAPAPTKAEVSATDAKPTDPAKAKKPKVLLTIPSKVIARAQGLAIFTAFRAGFQGTVSGGSGILIARKPDGDWSPPSGIKVGGVGGGFVIGAEIYDCVVVINTKEALDLFTKTRMSLGSDLAVTAGPFGAGGSLDWGVPANQKGKEKEKTSPQDPPVPVSPPLSADNTHFQTAPVSPGELTDPLEDPTKGRKPSALREAIGKPVYSYVKSHGVYAGVQISGTVILSRDTANAKFYGRQVTVQDILDGKVEPPAAARTLFDVLSGASAGWRGQSSASLVTPNFAPGSNVPHTTVSDTSGAACVTASVRGLDIGDPSTSSTAPRPTTPVVNAKAAEAAAERLASPTSPPPPSYSEYAPVPVGTQPPQEELPPAYVEGEGIRPPASDSKTGLH